MCDKKNKQLCDQLSYMAQYWQKQKASPYVMAYRRAVNSLAEFTAGKDQVIKITDVYQPSKNRKTGKDWEITEANIKAGRGKFPLKGVGKGVAQKIFQYLTPVKKRVNPPNYAIDGKIDEYVLALSDKLRAKKENEGKITKETNEEKQIRTLTKISFIGSATAKKLVQKNGIKNIDQLKSLAKSVKPDAKGAITFPAPRGKIKLSKNQRKMLFYHHKLRRIPREFTRMYELTTKYLIGEKFGYKGYKIVFSGSYRRGAADSGDIDFLVKGNVFTLQQMVNVLKQNKMIFDTLSKGKNDFKGMGQCPGNEDFIFRVDIMFTTNIEWYAALLHFTGNDALNRDMRMKAKELEEAKYKIGGKIVTKELPHGAILSQKGFFVRGKNNKSTGERVVNGGLKTEKQLFEILGMRYLKPTQRGTKVRVY